MIFINKAVHVWHFNKAFKWHSEMEYIMSTGKKSIQVVTVTRLKDPVCNSILNLQPPVAGKHLSLAVINAMAFLSFTTVAPKL